MSVTTVILGSGTAVPTPTRGAAGYLVVVGEQRLMLDCGPGSTRKLAQAGFSLTDLDRVLVSHFHPDHICDLIAIIFGSRIPGYARTRPLEIVGPVGIKRLYEKLAEAFGRWLVPEEFELKFSELDASPTSTAILAGEGYTVAARTVAHSYPAYCYRIETDRGVITYSGDTDYCDSIIELCHNADLAILECSTPDEAKINGHLTPGLAGRIAAAANVKHLVLSHFYPICEDIDILGQCRRSFAGQITLAQDLMRFTLD
ncbi:MAG: MBL fold metallo-hydrolase [Acidobacteriota bacterium]